MVTALTHGNIFTGEQWLTDHAVIIQDGLIRALCPSNQLPANISHRVDLGGKRLVAGLIDTQVNGGGGVLFNDAPSVEGLAQIGAAHRQFGTTGFYPTLISDDLAIVAKAIDAVKAAIKAKVPGVLGIHLEGPFLNPERRGVHDASKFRHLDEQAFTLLTSLPLGKMLVTLAPELTTPAMIRRLVDAGITVAAGHSTANYQETRNALAAGLSSFTHLFNAMTPFTSREPGMVGAALEDTQSWCGIIMDGFHVHPSSVKVAHQAKAQGKMVLVTDAMPSVGAANKAFQLNGEWIQYDNGKLTTANGTLAGSDLNMLAAVKNAIEWAGIAPDEALRMASQHPAEMMGETQLGKIAVGYRASMILIDDDYQLLASWIDGEAEFWDVVTAS